MKKRGMPRIQFAILLLCLAFISLLALGIFMREAPKANEVTAKATSQPESIMFSTEDSIIVPGMQGDLPNDKEGTIIWWTKPEMTTFKPFEGSKKFLVMFISNNVPGVMVAYNFEEQNLNGGTPLLHTPKINFFDNKPHQIGYTFKKGDKQSLYFDGQKLAESMFEPLTLGGISGFVVHDEIKLPKGDTTAIEKTETFDKALSEDELRSLLQQK